MKFTSRFLKLPTLMSAAVIALSAFADARADEKPTVGLVMKSLANEFFQTMEKGARDYQGQHTSEFSLVSNGIKNETDVSAQINLVDQLVVIAVLETGLAQLGAQEPVKRLVTGGVIVAAVIVDFYRIRRTPHTAV
jgi:ribose transport system substrate-binding protein